MPAKTKKKTAPSRSRAAARVHPPRSEAFVPLVYDILFSLMMFFGLEAVLRVGSATQLLLYVAMYAVILHWWLMFKTAEHRIDPGVRDAAHHVVLNIAYILILQIALLLAGVFEYVGAAAAVLALVAVDLLWTWNVRQHAAYGPRKKGAKEMRAMFDAIVRSDMVFGLPLTVLVLLGAVLTPAAFVWLFVFLVVSFIVITYRYGIMDLRHL